jgi:hypothetical protein
MHRLAILLPAVLLGLFALAPSPARAGLVLRLTDGSTTVTILDDGPGDAEPTLPGIIAYGGPAMIGNFTILPKTGATSKPWIGGANEAMIHLDVDVMSDMPTGQAAGSLRISMTDTGFSLADSTSPWQLLSSIGGMTDGSIGFFESLDPDNSEFGVTNPGNDITNTFPTLTGMSDDAFSAALATSGITPATFFSLWETVTITHGDGRRFTTLDADSIVTPQVIPEPASCLLWATGVAALGLWRARAKRRMGYN